MIAGIQEDIFFIIQLSFFFLRKARAERRKKKRPEIIKKYFAFDSDFCTWEFEGLGVSIIFDVLVAKIFSVSIMSSSDGVSKIIGLIWLIGVIGGEDGIIT